MTLWKDRGRLESLICGRGGTADAPVLEAGEVTHGGSIPLVRTNASILNEVQKRGWLVGRSPKLDLDIKDVSSRSQTSCEYGRRRRLRLNRWDSTASCDREERDSPLFQKGTPMTSIRSVKIPRAKAIAILRAAVNTAAAVKMVNDAQTAKYDAEIQKWFKKLPKSAMTLDLAIFGRDLERGRATIAFDHDKYPAPKQPEYISNPNLFNGYAKELKLLEMSTSASVPIAYNSVIYKLL